MAERRFLPQDQNLFSSNALPLRDVEVIGLFRRDFDTLFPDLPETLRMHFGKSPFPSGNATCDMQTTVETLWETAESIERVLAVHDDFKQRYGEGLLSLQGTMHVRTPDGDGNVPREQRLRQMADFIYGAYGRPIDINVFFQERLFDRPLEELRVGTDEVARKYEQDSVGRMLAQLREVEKISGTEVARRVGWTQPQVSQLEHNYRLPTLNQTAQYLMAIGHILPQQDYVTPEARLAIVRVRELRAVQASGRRGRV